MLSCDTSTSVVCASNCISVEGYTTLTLIKCFVLIRMLNSIPKRRN